MNPFTYDGLEVIVTRVGAGKHGQVGFIQGNPRPLTLDGSVFGVNVLFENGEEVVYTLDSLRAKDGEALPVPNEG